MHTRIDLDMHRQMLKALSLCGTDNFIQHLQRVYIRLKIILNNQVQSHHLWVHNNDRQSDACFAEFHTLIGHRYGQVVDQSAILQRTANLHTASAIGESLNHTGELRMRLQQRTEIAHIIHQSREVDLQDSIVRLVEDTLCDGIFVVA